MDPGVTELLVKHQGYFEVQANGRLVCTLNKHSLPPSRQALETFVRWEQVAAARPQTLLSACTAFCSGKKYAQLRRKAEEAKALSRFEPFLVPSKNFP